MSDEAVWVVLNSQGEPESEFGVWRSKADADKSCFDYDREFVNSPDSPRFAVEYVPLSQLAAVTAERDAAYENDWTASLLDRLNELVSENTKYFSRVSTGPDGCDLIRNIHGVFNTIKHQRDAAVEACRNAHALLYRIGGKNHDPEFTELAAAIAAAGGTP